MTRMLEIQNRLKELEKFLDTERAIYREKVESSEKELDELIKEEYKLFIENKMYCPMSKLQDFKRDDDERPDIYRIKIVLGDGDYKSLYGEIIYVDDNGHLYFSDYEQGIIEFNKEKGKYTHSYWGDTTELDFVGFYDIELGWCMDHKKVKETDYKELIRCHVNQ